MGFKRHRKVGMSSKEATDQKAHVSLQSQDLKLDGMHQCAKEGAVGDSLVRHYDIQEGHRSHLVESAQLRRDDFGDLPGRSPKSSRRSWADSKSQAPEPW